MKPNRRQILLLLWDVLFLAGGFYLAYFVRLGAWFEPTYSPLEFFQTRTGATVLVVGIHLGVYYVFDLYNPAARYRFWPTLRRFFFAGLASLFLIAATYYFIPHYSLGRGIVGIASVFYLPLLTLWRVHYSMYFPQEEARRNSLLLGNGGPAEYLLAELGKAQDKPFNVVGIVDDKLEPGASVDGVRVLGRTRDLESIVADHGVRTIILSDRKRSNKRILSRILDLKLRGIEILDLPNAYKTATHKLPLDHIDLHWMVDARGFGTINHPVVQRIHRVADVAVALAGLGLGMPVMLLAALGVRLSSRGPVFYRQTRVGLNEKRFEILKFRTMVDNAEAACGPVFSDRGDRRVTFAGRVLRRTRVDELPQLWNVLKGEMSLIGPRPERPHFVEKYKKDVPYYPLRFSVKPGLTGWAQVMYRYGSSDLDTREKLQYDLYYIQEMSLPLDLHILLKTLQTVVSKRGS